MTESNDAPAPGAGTPPTDTPVVGYGINPLAGAYDGPPPTKEETNMGLLMFILAIFTGFLGPLILWLVKKAESKYLDAQGKEILNYMITMIGVLIINIPLWFVIIGIFIHFGVLIASLVFFILGAMKASKGAFYRFPFAIRLLK